MREMRVKTVRNRRPALPATEARYRQIVAEWARGSEPEDTVAARHGIAAATLFSQAVGISARV